VPAEVDCEDAVVLDPRALECERRSLRVAEPAHVRQEMSLGILGDPVVLLHVPE